MYPIERQTIVTWHDPKTKKPKEGDITVTTVSGKVGNVKLEHTFALAEWYDDGDGWVVYGIDKEPDIDAGDFIKIEAWADLDPYGEETMEGSDVSHCE